jgi:catalase
MTISLAAHAQAQTPAQAEPSPAALVDALNNTFGKHAGKRASHAKGFCATGVFTPVPGAAGFAGSPLFRQSSVAAQLRFSVGGGNPGVSDKSRSVRGLTMRLSGGGEVYDLLLLSEPVFFAATPASFVSFLEARVPDPVTKKPDPQKIAAHNAAYPDGARQPALLAAHAAPQSYATTPYFSNNAFVFGGEGQAKQHARIVVEPQAGTHYLSAEQEQSLPDQFLQAELRERLGKEGVAYTIYAQLPAVGDSLSDPSLPWQGSAKVALGMLAVQALDDAGACDGVVFMPGNLPASITMSADPILRSRAAAYAVSLARRSSGR